jgi:hypothetical protein
MGLPPVWDACEVTAAPQGDQGVPIGTLLRVPPANNPNSKRPIPNAQLTTLHFPRIWRFWELEFGPWELTGFV